MLYQYIKLSDGTEISHSQIVEKNGVKTVLVHFERVGKNGDFDTARCELPEYNWIIKKGYSEEEIQFFAEFLEHNAHLIYKYAAEGGLKIA